MRARLLVLAILAVLAAIPSAADAQRSDSRVWWDEKRKAYPQCNALTNDHERLTDELERISEQARYAKEPQRKQIFDTMNATAKQRTAVQDKLFACIRASGSKPNTADSGQKKPPLQGKVEENETPQKPPPGPPPQKPPIDPPPGGPNYPPYNPGPKKPGVVVIPERPIYPPPGRPDNPPQPLPGPKHPDEIPERIPPRRPPPEVPQKPTPPTRHGPSLEAGLRKGFAECGQMFRNLGLAALAAVHPQFILENRNYVEAAKYLGVTSSDQGLRFLFHEITAPTLRGGLNWEESCNKNVGDEEAGLRIARRLCFWGLPNPTYKALKGARPKPKPQPPLPGSPTNPLTEAEVMGGLGGKAYRPDLSGKTIALPPPDGGVHLGNVTLGERLGQGAFKDVYAIEGHPGLSLQILHKVSEGAQSVLREVKGYDLIKNNIETPAVHAHRSAPGGLSYMIKDRLPSDAFFEEPTPELLAGIKQTEGKLVDLNAVWPDGHHKNYYAIRDAQGRRVFGIHDTDMITLASDPAVAAELSRLVPLFHKEGPAGFKKLCEFNTAAQDGTLNAASFMHETFRLRYEVKPKPPQ
jgi:hypothetical protein